MPVRHAVFGRIHPPRRLWRWLLPALLLLTGCRLGTRTIVADDFDSADGAAWEMAADDLGRAAVRDGRLILELDAPDALQFVRLAEPQIANFALEVDATFEAGDFGNTYGVLYRMQGNSAFYRFELTGDGSYVVEKRLASGEWERLSAGWVESDAILTGLNVTNRIGVSMRDSRMALYINGKLVERHDLGADFYGPGTIALDVGTYRRGGVRVAFDNFVLREP